MCLETRSRQQQLAACCFDDLRHLVDLTLPRQSVVFADMDYTSLVGTIGGGPLRYQHRHRPGQ